MECFVPIRCSPLLSADQADTKRYQSLTIKQSTIEPYQTPPKQNSTGALPKAKCYQSETISKRRLSNAIDSIPSNQRRHLTSLKIWAALRIVCILGKKFLHLHNAGHCPMDTVHLHVHNCAGGALIVLEPMLVLQTLLEHSPGTLKPSPV